MQGGKPGVDIPFHIALASLVGRILPTHFKLKEAFSIYGVSRSHAREFADGLDQETTVQYKNWACEPSSSR
jgi:hypothetical protein